MITAEKIYKEILELPVKEREKLFVVIARKAFEKDEYTHDEIFADLAQTTFTIQEAAEYLEVAVITVRRWVKEKKLTASRIGKSLVFNVDDLKMVKKGVAG